MATQPPAHSSGRTAERVITFGLVVALVVGLVFLATRRSDPGLELVLPTATPPPQLRIYVSGAVARPGVYTLTSGSRVEDGVFVAGGPTAAADLARINLAQRLYDGQQVHVPARGETLSMPTADARVNINAASVAALEALPGIGEVRAKRIVEYRESSGPFHRIEQLVEARLIPASVFEQIRGRLTVE